MARRRPYLWVFASVLGLIVAAVVGAPSAVALPASTSTIVAASDPTPTQVGTVDEFISLTLTATGTTAFCNNAPQCYGVGPNGGPFVCSTAGTCPYPNADVGALIYKVGMNGAWQFAGTGPVVVTSSSPTQVPVYALYDDVVGTYGDNSGSYTVTATGQVVANPGCTGPIITGTHSALTVTSGTTCVYGATITGGISVAAGASLFIVNSTIDGSISAHAPGAVGICGSHTGSISVTAATGLVRIGDPAENCASNTIDGGLTVANNTGGIIVVKNTISGSWAIANNSGDPVTVSGNHH